MRLQRCASYVLVAGLALALAPDQEAAAQRKDDRKPSLSFKAEPPVGFTPLRVRVTVEVRGGADDSPDFYCPTIERDWGNELKSERSEDCAPYEAGKSEIRRRYSNEHTYREPGQFTARFRMKQGGKVVASSSSNITVRGGIRDDGDF
jgi:hypothetical protein